MNASATRHPDPRIARLIVRFETLSAAALGRLDQVYVEDALFRDPFQEVRGVAAIAAVYRHMYSALEDPRFLVRDAVVEGGRCFLSWDFEYALRRSAVHRVHGGSLLRLAADGRIAEHLDYWDASALYETLPVVGAPLRWLRARMRGASA